MDIVKSIRSYVSEDETKIIIFDNKMDIVNYIDIGHFDSNKIVIKTMNKKIIVNGNDLTVSKLMNDEILITGSFNNIEIR